MTEAAELASEFRRGKDARAFLPIWAPTENPARSYIGQSQYPQSRHQEETEKYRNNVRVSMVEPTRSESEV